MRSVMNAASSDGHAFEHERETSRLLERHRFVDQPPRVVGALALHLESAERVHRLRRQADVTHHRDLGVEDRLDGFDAARLSAFDLHRLRAGLDERARRCAPILRPTRGTRGTACRRRRARATRRARRRARVVEHVVDRDAQRVGVSEDDHAEGVADEDDVGAGGVGDLRARVVVRGEHSDPLRRLHRPDRRDGDSFRCLCHFFLHWTEEGGGRAEDAIPPVRTGSLLCPPRFRLGPLLRIQAVRSTAFPFEHFESARRADRNARAC